MYLKKILLKLSLCLEDVDRSWSETTNQGQDSCLTSVIHARERPSLFKLTNAEVLQLW